MELSVPIVVFVVALLVVARFFARRRHRALSSSGQASADELQSFLTGCVNDLRRVLGQQGKDPELMRREAYDILARMESRNSGGSLDDFIQDNRESVDLALKRGDSA